MTVELGREPIKIGVLFDLLFPPPNSWDPQNDFMDGLTMAIDEGHGRGLIDRTVEFVRRDVDGLPRGSVKVVIDAWQELVDEGAILIVGPLISENALPLKEYIERGHFVPSFVV